MNKVTFKSANGKFAGTLEGEVLWKKVKKSRHLYQTLNGWGWDEEIIMQASQKGAQELKIIETEENKVYRVDIALFMDKAVEVNYGYGRQLILPIQYWILGNDKQMKLL